jgi:SAM-dependent methyltransferase
VHPEAFSWVAKYAEPADTVLDIGGRNINGTVRDLFPGSAYTSLDILPGEGVDIVADASIWNPDKAYDVVVCAEVFEHTPSWQRIIGTAWRSLRKGGLFICTMAGPGRPEHSAIDGGAFLHPDEHYANIDPDELELELERWFRDVVVDYQTSPADTRAIARRR